MQPYEKFVSSGGYVCVKPDRGRVSVEVLDHSGPALLEPEEQAELAIVLLHDLADRASEPMQQRVLYAAIDSVDRELTRAVFPNHQPAKETTK